MSAYEDPYTAAQFERDEEITLLVIDSTFRQRADEVLRPAFERLMNLLKMTGDVE